MTMKTKRVFNDPKPINPKNYFETKWVLVSVAICILLVLVTSTERPQLSDDIFLAIIIGILISPILQWVFQSLIRGIK